MKKNQFGWIELLGYTGLLVWVGIVLLRGVYITNSGAYIFLRGILPNLGAAWAATMFMKWVVVLLLKRAYTLQWHFILCAAVLILAVLSEVVHHFFFNSRFDIYDIAITVIAQALMFLIPVLTKSKCFEAKSDAGNTKE